MKAVSSLALAAALAASATAEPHNHLQRHRLAKKHEHLHAQHKRAVETVIETKYVMEGTNEAVSDADALKGIADGLYVVVGTSTPTPATSAPSSTAAPSTTLGAQFYEKQSSTAPVAASSAPAAWSSSPASSGSSSSSSSGGTAGSLINSDFPNDTIACTDFAALAPYGVINAPGANMNGWTTIVKSVGSLLSMLSDIVAGVGGDDCGERSVCSYACQPGYQKAQWPESAQGTGGQTVGGVYCYGGKLLLTRASVTKKLCLPGEGGVYIRSELGESDAVCRTDYPGSESMVIPLEVPAGGQVPLTNTMNTFFLWKGNTTTAQYYVNPKGLPVKDACLWNSPEQPLCAGNWAPTILGVGKDVSGVTYLSIFPNTPTTTCKLNFDITITGDISGSCSLKNGVYSSPSGCTVGVKEGGTATYVFSESS